MPRNGLGVYVPPAGQPVVTATTISSAVFNTLVADLGTEITRSVSTDGQTPMAAILPMGGFKISGLGLATLPSDAVRLDQLTSPDAASRVGYLHAVGVDVTNVQIALRAELKNVNLYFIAGEADATAMFNRATAAAHRVYVPAGSYTLSSAGWPSDTEIFGDGDSTILLMPATAAYLITNDSGSSDPANNIKNGRMRDLQVRATCDADGFSQYKHIVSINGVTNFAFENVLFKGFRGDGLYIGSSNTGGLERHNSHISVRRCRFDGINNANRNGISVIDCDDIAIENNDFINCTRSDMPGCIDIEPDSNLFHIMRNVRITGNKFKASKTGVSCFLPAYFTTPATKFVIRDNYADGCTFGFIFDESTNNAPGGGLSDASVDTDVTIETNTAINCTTPLFVRGVKGALIRNNEFQDCTSHAYVGDGGFNRLYSFNVTYDGNRHIRCGSTSQFGLVVDGVTGFRHKRNRYTDCGNGAAGSAGVNFAPSIANGVTLLDFTENDFTSPAGKMLAAVVKTAGGSISFAYRDIVRNSYGGLTSLFPSDSGSFTPKITGSTTVGDGGQYSLQVGRYARFGDVATVNFSITLTSHTGTGAAFIDLNDIPFLSKNVNGNHFIPASITFNNLNVGAGKMAGAALQNNARLISLYIEDPAGGAVALETLAVDSAFTVYGSVTYEIA